MACAYPINAQQSYIIKPSRTNLIDGNVPAGSSSDGKSPTCASKVITCGGDHGTWSERNGADIVVLWTLPWFPLPRDSYVQWQLRQRRLFACSSSLLILWSLQGHCLCPISVHLHYFYMAKDYCVHLQ